MLKPDTPSFTNYFRKIDEVEKMSNLASEFLKVFGSTLVNMGKESLSQATEQVLLPELNNLLGKHTDEELERIIDGLRVTIIKVIEVRDVPSVVHAAERLGVAIPQTTAKSIHGHAYGKDDRLNEYLHEFFSEDAFLSK